MRRLATLALALGLPLVHCPSPGPDGSAVAQETAPAGPSLRSSVEQSLKQLDSPKLADRVHAERTLLDLGPDVLSYLPPPELTASVAVREAVKRIRVQLERRAARESAEASRVRLSGEMTVAAILQEFTAQTRNRIELGEDAQPLSSQTVRVEFDNQPFWECVDHLCGQLRLYSVFQPQQGTLQLRRRTAMTAEELQVQRTGPYRLAVLAAQIRPIVGNPSQRLLRITGKVGLEPRLRPLFLHFAAADVTARGLDPWNSAARYELPVGDAGRDVPVQFDYLIPAGDDRSAIDLRGRLSVQLAAGTERIIFDQTAQTPGATRRRGGVSVRLREVRFESQPDAQLRAEIKVLVKYDTGGPAFESHRTWMFHNAVYLETESGQRAAFTDYDTSLQADGAVGVDYRWKQLAGPATRYHFVYEAPTLIIDLPLEIKLDGVPIQRVAGTPPSRDD